MAACQVKKKNNKQTKTRQVSIMCQWLIRLITFLQFSYQGPIKAQLHCQGRYFSSSQGCPFNVGPIVHEVSMGTSQNE